ncbi:MAG TPA: HAMP domain-containing sensor histidine kinase [Longimicrobiales bacterium]
MLGRHSLERRLFGWMLGLALAPALIMVLVGVWVWAGSLDWVGTLGPWDRVAESGRVVLEAAASAAAEDPALAEALERHREELSASLRLARRWDFLERRVSSMVPVLALVVAVAIAWMALVASRRVARELARPIGELVGWADRLAREEPLPAAEPGEAREVAEVRALRAAFRRAACELAAARRRALEAERVRVWGEMARRVAHEMKNPLTPLRLAAHRLARSGGGAADWAEPIAVILEETERLEELARQFSALGRPPDGPTSPVDVRELVAALLETDVPPGVERVLAGAGEVPLVDGHYDALVRAFRNLLRNAVEAMEGSARPRRIEVTVSAVDGGVEVVVADTGTGLPSDALERIFAPDFTTKSRGTGLGLALVRQAVAAHGGEVRARNRPEGGAEFVVRLPVAGGEPAAARA